MSEPTNGTTPPVEEAAERLPPLRREAQLREDRAALAPLLLLIATFGGIGIGFGLSLMIRIEAGAPHTPRATALRSYAYGVEVAPCERAYHGAWLGVSIRPADGGRAGAQIDEVVAGTPAASLGLRPGDVVTKVDGASVVESDDLPALLASRVPGDSVKLQVVRDGRPATYTVALAAR